MSNNERNFNSESKFAWVDQFAAKVSERTGRDLGIEHVHSDELGWEYYIKARSLKESHPLLLNHYRGPLFVVIPYKDYNRLEKGEIDPITYVDNAKWNYGYFWGGGSMIRGAFWQPLEDGVGIHDKEKISRYLTILRCRTFKKSCGYMPNAETCLKCAVEKCPFSKCEEKSTNSDWAKEVEEKDYRINLIKAVNKRIDEELSLKIQSVYCYSGKNALVIPNGIEMETCSLYLPVDMLNDILYNPGERDWETIANELQFELGLARLPDRVVMNYDCLMVSPSEFCRKFWQNFGYGNEVNQKEVSSVKAEKKPKAWWIEKLKSIFKINK